MSSSSSSSKKAKGKRRAEAEAPAPPPPSAADAEGEGEELEFEDEYPDDIEEEQFVDDEGEEMGDEDEEGAPLPPGEEMASDGVRAEVEGQLYRAGDAMSAGEKLDYDSSAYDMLHRLHVEWPSLTFSFVRDTLGEQRTKYPMTAYTVCGTQAERSSQNQLVCQKLSKLARTRHDEDDDSDDDSDDEADEDPIVESQTVPHEGTVNRLRLMPQRSDICATWADTGKVHIFNLSTPLAKLHSPGSAAATSGTEECRKPLFTFGGHDDEGYALDFSAAKPGLFASGDCASRLHVWHPAEGGSWEVDPQPYVGHRGSIEDVAWSPVEANVLMSCGCDSTVRVWDARRKSGSALTVDEGHGQDINVLSWNKLVNYLVVTGCDDGSFRVWDLRKFKEGQPVANLKWHRGAITSVEWSPAESSTIAVAGADNQITLWDLALEADPEAEIAHAGRPDLEDIPPQLYFVHQGQTDIKELHWHAQLPGVLGSTAGDGFHIFKPANAGDGNVHE